jgi:tRNA pseudouridine38-40 synthase
LDIEAYGFLYNMVRIIMGTLLQVGYKRMDAKDVEKVIESANRAKAGPTAAPQGLYLVSVNYPLTE